MSYEPEAIASETYQKLLLPKGHGIPLYFPDLYDSLPAACRDRGVAIGDVGIITDDGSFDFLFNVCLPCSHPINIDRTPPSFQMVVLNESIDLGSRRCGFPSNSSVVSSYVKKTALSVGTSVTNAAIAAGGGASYQFTCHHSQGAILHLPDGAERHNLQNLRKFREVALDHGAGWYDHARECFGRDAPDGSLYLVTGCDKSKSWGIASFSDVSEDSGFSLKFTTTPIGDPNTTYRSSWDNVSPATVRIGPDDFSDKWNQCVFVRGFKITVRESPLAARFLGTVKLTSAPKSKSPRNPGGYSRFRQGGPQSSTSSSPRNRRSGSSPSSQESPPTNDFDLDSNEPSHGDGIFDNEIVQDHESTYDGVSVDLFPDRSASYHPLQFIGNYLLNAFPKAQVAVTHDNEWCSMLTDNDTEIPDDEEFLRRINDNYKVVLRGDGTFLLPSSEQESLAQHPNTFPVISYLEFGPCAQERALANVAPTDENRLANNESIVLVDATDETSPRNDDMALFEAANEDGSVNANSNSMHSIEAAGDDQSTVLKTRSSLSGKDEDLKETISYREPLALYQQDEIVDIHVVPPDTSPLPASSEFSMIYDHYWPSPNTSPSCSSLHSDTDDAFLPHISPNDSHSGLSQWQSPSPFNILQADGSGSLFPPMPSRDEISLEYNFSASLDGKCLSTCDHNEVSGSSSPSSYGEIFSHSNDNSSRSTSPSSPLSVAEYPNTHSARGREHRGTLSSLSSPVSSPYNPCLRPISPVKPTDGFLMVPDRDFAKRGHRRSHSDAGGKVLDRRSFPLRRTSDKGPGRYPGPRIPPGPVIQSQSAAHATRLDVGVVGPSGMSTPAGVDLSIPNVDGMESMSLQDSTSHQFGGKASVIKHQLASDVIATASKSRRMREARFVCTVPGCNATFTANHNLKNHMNSHSGIKDFKCESCEAQFTTAGVLARHIKNTHSQPPT